jgi:cell fate (sporulation/competence/biofilm development) regulator YlbF (YheA/YmcA/DUF963 family)
LLDLKRIFSKRVMMQEIMEMAERLGRALARTEQYQALRRAIAASGDDRGLAELQSQVQDLEQQMRAQLQGGEEPTDEQGKEYEAFFSRLQANASYQRLVSAQANFDKIVTRVNETIHQGIETGAESRIILS